MEGRRNDPLELTLGIVLAVPVLGLLLGGVYSVPAMWLTKEREPWLSALLTAGLAITVFGLGRLSHTPFECSIWAWAAAICHLHFTRMLRGSIGHDLERFGVVHCGALAWVSWAWLAARLG